MRQSLILFSISFVLLSCSREVSVPQSNDKKLPEISTTGKNTFGFLKNGVVWLPDKGGKAVTELSVSVGRNYLLINALLLKNKELQDFFSVHLDNESGLGVGTYYKVNGAFYILNDHNTDCDYSIESTSVAKIEILRFDTINRVVSGTFSGILTDSAGCDTIRIEQGRFDMRIN